ncbi:heavy metal translocating P-type ATPase [Nitrospira moscoviensis]|uniref:Cation-transporting ATPase n=1 Tax=Nitrospira moscoviensis TaxID=42253 RepID=A0A0K2GJS2_NITMO|nr:heavy metal translocating P-type ATPase [Nitrospira moscoviensis]ALA61099.1 Cation-transporting ATPase [Nitrospira moscoviensis]
MPWIKDQPDLAQGLAAWLGGLQGITQSEANADCASVTLCYEEGTWTGAKLCRRLNGLTPRQIARLPVANTPSGTNGTQHSSWFELSLSSTGVALGLLCEPLAPVLVPLLLAGSALPMLKRAYEALAKEGRLTVDVLDASATALLGLQGRFSMATFMVWLINLGDYIRDATVSQAKAAVESVLSYQESYAWVVKGRRKVKLPVPNIAVGDTVIVYPGDRIPVDGVVLSGKATVDQRALTGESLPVEKEAGASVYAATVIHDGKLYIRASRVGDQTEAAKIVRLVEGAPAHETAIQNYAERWANDLVPYSFMGAGARGLMAGGASAAASVLVIDYGTGIRIAAPTAVLATMTKAVRQGILFKGGRALEQLAAVDAVVLDKTGTLTTGRPEVTEVRAYGNAGRDKVLALAAAAEQRLNHPVAQAIVRAATDAKLAVPSRKSSDYSIGLGVTSHVNGYVVHVGCTRYMKKLGIDVPDDAQRDLARFGEQAVSPVCVAMDHRVIGLIGYADQIRSEAASVVQSLRDLGVKEIVMLTGDHPDVAAHVAKHVGITRYAADVLPERKLEEVKSLQQRGYRVAFIGDGINDSPALAHADIGIAVKGGADVAQDTAHVVLLNGDLAHIPLAIQLAREAVDLIHENWNIIAVPNTVALALACFGVLGPGAATLLSNGSAILATGNSLRPLWSNGAGLQSKARRARSITTSATERAMA